MVRTGINDGISTEILEGLNEGDQIVIGLIAQEDDNSQRPVNPFAAGGGGGRRRF